MNKNWKNDPNEFMKMKIRYSGILGVLQGALYLIQQIEPLLDEKSVEKMHSIYSDLYVKSEEEIEEITGDIVNCGYIDQQPDINWIVEDQFLQEKFPVKS